MKIKLIDRIGEIATNSEGLKMWIKEYRGALDLDIEFENGYIIKNQCYSNFKKGQIKNPYYRSVYGVGYLGEGKYLATIDGKHTNQYKEWIGIFVRCYNEKKLKKNITYEDCVIHEEWHNFQNFAKWYDDNYYEINDEKMHIDKDILFKGNKVYSPETCVFVPQNINKLFTKRQNYRGKYPIGVSFNKNNDSFVARVNKNKKSIFLGCYDIPEKAFEVYKTEKEKCIKEIADEYKSKIPQKLYDALYKYKVEIID